MVRTSMEKNSVVFSDLEKGLFGVPDKGASDEDKNKKKVNKAYVVAFILAAAACILIGTILYCLSAEERISASVNPCASVNHRHQIGPRVVVGEGCKRGFGTNFKDEGVSGSKKKGTTVARRSPSTNEDR